MSDLVGRAGRAAQDHVAGDKKHAWRAEAALQAVGLREAAPNEVHQRLILEVFESLELLPVDRGGEGDATPNGSAVYQDRAGPTDAMLAGKVRRREIQFIAYKRADRLPRIDSGAAALAVRSEERRVGKEGVSTCRSRGPPDHKKKKKSNN